MRRAVFIDRDGTLVREKDYLAHPEELELYAGSAEALRRLRAAGWALVLVTNQSGVARGFFSEAEVRAVHERLQELLALEGLALDGIYYCPHHPEGKVPEYRADCECRKPKPGLIARATRELELDVEASWIVGDSRSDVDCGRELGLRSILVRTGYGAATEAGLPAGAAQAVVNDLLAAAAWILDREAAR